MTVYAEQVNYWKTGTTAAASWMEKAGDEIRSIGGKVYASANCAASVCCIPTA